MSSISSSSSSSSLHPSSSSYSNEHESHSKPNSTHSQATSNSATKNYSYRTPLIDRSKADFLSSMKLGTEVTGSRRKRQGSIKTDAHTYNITLKQDGKERNFKLNKNEWEQVAKLVAFIIGRTIENFNQKSNFNINQNGVQADGSFVAHNQDGSNDSAQAFKELEAFLNAKRAPQSPSSSIRTPPKRSPKAASPIASERSRSHSNSSRNRSPSLSSLNLDDIEHSRRNSRQRDDSSPLRDRFPPLRENITPEPSFSNQSSFNNQSSLPQTRDIHYHIHYHWPQPSSNNEAPISPAAPAPQATTHARAKKAPKRTAENVNNAQPKMSSPSSAPIVNHSFRPITPIVQPSRSSSKKQQIIDFFRSLITLNQVNNQSIKTLLTEALNTNRSFASQPLTFETPNTRQVITVGELTSKINEVDVLHIFNTSEARETADLLLTMTLSSSIRKDLYGLELIGSMICVNFSAPFFLFIDHNENLAVLQFDCSQKYPQSVISSLYKAPFTPNTFNSIPFLEKPLDAHGISDPSIIHRYSLIEILKDILRTDYSSLTKHSIQLCTPSAIRAISLDELSATIGEVYGLQAFSIAESSGIQQTMQGRSIERLKQQGENWGIIGSILAQNHRSPFFLYTNEKGDVITLQLEDSETALQTFTHSEEHHTKSPYEIYPLAPHDALELKRRILEINSIPMNDVVDWNPTILIANLNADTVFSVIWMNSKRESVSFPIELQSLVRPMALTKNPFLQLTSYQPFFLSQYDAMELKATVLENVSDRIRNYATDWNPIALIGYFNSDQFLSIWENSKGNLSSLSLRKAVIALDDSNQDTYTQQPDATADFYTTTSDEMDPISTFSNSNQWMDMDPLTTEEVNPLELIRDKDMLKLKNALTQLTNAFQTLQTLNPKDKNDLNEAIVHLIEMETSLYEINNKISIHFEFLQDTYFNTDLNEVLAYSKDLHEKMIALKKNATYQNHAESNDSPLFIINVDLFNEINKQFAPLIELISTIS